MRVLHVLWSLDIGGAERAVYQLVRAQRRRGLTADVLVASRAGYYGEQIRHAGASVHELRQGSAAEMRSTARARAIFRQYDVVHFHSAEIGLAALALGTPARTFYTHRAGAFAYPWRQALRYRAAGPIFKRFTGISANTDHAARVVSTLFGVPLADITTTYNGLEFELAAPSRDRESVLAELGEDGDGFRVATIANLRRIKRIDRLIEAVQRLEGRARCYVIGDGPDRRRLEALVDRLAVREHVTFLGLKENVFDYLQLMDAFVLPTGCEESFGNAAVEAMALALPVIVFDDGGGLLEHVRDGRTGFIASDKDALVEILARLASDPALGTRVGEMASAFVRRRYTVDDMTAAYDRLYGLDRDGEPTSAALLSDDLKPSAAVPADDGVPAG